MTRCADRSFKSTVFELFFEELGVRGEGNLVRSDAAGEARADPHDELAFRQTLNELGRNVGGTNAIAFHVLSTA